MYGKKQLYSAIVDILVTEGAIHMYSSFLQASGEMQ